MLAQELIDYEIRVEPDANDKYGVFKVGTHDDLVTALGLAVQDDGEPLGRALQLQAEADRQTHQAALPRQRGQTIWEYANDAGDLGRLLGRSRPWDDRGGLLIRLQPHRRGRIPPEQRPVPDGAPGHHDAAVPGLGHDRPFLGSGHHGRRRAAHHLPALWRRTVG